MTYRLKMWENPRFFGEGAAGMPSPYPLSSRSAFA